MLGSENTSRTAPPPPGATPVPVFRDEGLQRICLAALIPMLVVPTVLIFLRVYFACGVIKQWNATDTTCIVAWCFMVAQVALAFAQFHFGAGVHRWDLSAAEFSELSKVFNVAEIIYIPAICLAKTAVLLQLYQIFARHVSKRRGYLLTGVFLFNAVFYTALFFLQIFGCPPREWIGKSVTPGSCIDIEKAFIVTGTINVLDDLVMLALPLAWIWQLQMPQTRKLGVSAVFATGVFACICSVTRLVESVISMKSTDTSRAIMSLGLWATAEVCCGVALPSLPLLPGIYRSFKLSASDASHPHAETRTQQPTTSVTGRFGRLTSDDNLHHMTESGAEMQIGHLSSAAVVKKDFGTTSVEPRSESIGSSDPEPEL